MGAILVFSFTCYAGFLQAHPSIGPPDIYKLELNDLGWTYLYYYYLGE